jgi:hypothetical protein
MAALIVTAATTIPGDEAVARCPNFEDWPSFAEFAPSARRVIVGTVSGAVEGMATEIQVEEVLRGRSRQIVDLDRLRSRLPRGSEETCAFDGTIRADVGDRLAIAFNGRVEGWPGLLDTAALVDAASDHPNESDLERFATPDVHRLTGVSPEDDPQPPAE